MDHITDLEIFIKMISDSAKKIALEEGACIVLNKEAIAHNINFYKKFGAEVGAAVKADSYGCGVKNILPILLENGVTSFFVHNVKEGIQVRELSKNGDIYILAPILTNGNIELIEKYNLIPVVYDVEGLKNYLNHPSPHKKFGLHVETGINRNGIIFEDIEEIKKLIMGFEPEIMVSHIGCAYQNTHYNKVHGNIFEKFKKAIPNCKKYSLHASESVFLGGNMYDMIRIGIGLFGIDLSKNIEGKLKNSLFVYSRVLQIKKVKKGDYVGYKAAYVAENDVYVGVVNFGYNDGLPRFPEGKVSINFKEHKMPLVGVTSMDLACVVVPNNLIKEIEKEPIVEIFGNDARIQDLAKNQIMSTLGILTRFKRYPFFVE